MKPPSDAGVYRIVCVPTAKVYVGSALSMRRRLDGHRSSLNTGKHPNAHLQAAWSKYGADAFVFEVVEIVDAGRLLECEQRHIDSHDAANRVRGFNIRPKAESNVGLPVSPETRARISAANKGRMVSAETRAKIGAKHKGKVISLEARAKMAAAKRGKKLSEAHKARLSALVRARGPEYHARLSASKIGNKNSLGRKHPPEVLAKIATASLAMWAARRLT